ncbi:hypothetical protein, partial [Burkholderia thailandensis]|uniref:hypothetical protein n=1 Tax=Burkholderia thailandensis TaxID=57975 RepID=UPI003F68B258
MRSNAPRPRRACAAGRAGQTTSPALARIASPPRRARHDAHPAPAEDCRCWCFHYPAALDLSGAFAPPHATVAAPRSLSATPLPL